MNEFGPVEERLARIEDKLADLIGVQLARAGKKPPEVPPSPRPVPAAKRVQDRKRLAKHKALVARVLPGSGAPRPGIGPMDGLSRVDRRPTRN